MDLIRLFALILVSGCAVPQRAGNEISWDREGREAVVLLQEMIRIDTTNPAAEGSPNETALLLRVKEILSAHGIESRIYEAAPGRGNLVARYRSGGTRRAMMILAHVDVVNADPGMWETDPLSGEIRDGFLWGRGALDDKGMAAVGVRVMCLLGRIRPELDRDVILMLNADEESGGKFGAKYMRDRYGEELDCAFVLNEGGRIALGADGRVSRVSLQCSEKVYNDFRLWMPGRSGHSSVPVLPNAIFDLAVVLARLKDFQLPVRVTPIMAQHFKAVAGFPENHPFREMMEKVGRGDRESARRLSALRPDFNAVLRTTFVPTEIRGGIRVNVLPPSAEVNFNVRMLPGDNLREVMEAMARRAGLGEVPVMSVEEFEASSPASRENPVFVLDTQEVDAPDSPWDHEVVRAVIRLLARMSPGATVVPVMLTGATDSRFFRERGVPSYGIHPCPSGLEELRTIHNHNERVRVSSVKWGVRWLYELVLELGKYQ